MKYAEGIFVFDNVLPDPIGYRERALELPYRTYDFGKAVFQGIGVPGSDLRDLEEWIKKNGVGLTPKVTFMRRSPLGQPEPNMVHADTEMGDWTAVLYLNPDPDKDDGTDFWKHANGDIEDGGAIDLQQEWSIASRWKRIMHIRAQFNRLLVFPSRRFHSRAIEENYGFGGDARLVQVVFGSGLPLQFSPSLVTAEALC